MKIIKMQKALFVAAGLLTAFITLSAAQASAVTVTYGYGLEMEEHPTEILESGLLPRFDTSLGTLTGATLQISGSATTRVSLHNQGPNPVEVLTSVTTDLIWTSGLAPLNELMCAENNTQCLYSSAGPSLSLNPEVTVSWEALKIVDTRSFNLAAILPFLQSAGYSNFDLNLQSVSALSIDGGGSDLKTLLTSTSGGGASITYTYLPTTLPSIFPEANLDAVPEPGATLLAGLALFGAISQRRRTQS